MRLRRVSLMALAAFAIALFSAVLFSVIAARTTGLDNATRFFAAAAAVSCAVSACLVIWAYRSAAGLIFEIAETLGAGPPPRGRAGPATELPGLMRSAAARHAALMRVTGAALFELAPDGSIEYANDGAARMLGTSLSELKGRGLIEFVEAASRASFTTLLNAAGEDASRGFTTTLVSARGLHIRVRVRAGRVTYGAADAGLVVTAEKADDDAARLAQELDRTRKDAKSTAERLSKTINDLEEFALLAVRRELKMREIRERLAEASKGGAAPGPYAQGNRAGALKKRP